KFSRWLRSGEGVFWVSGKAGSGKSTLMKYISQQAMTAEILQDWSREKPVVVASHFFWAGGASMQKSETGLLRTLLFEIFLQSPELIRLACQHRWESRDRGADWSYEELSKTLRVLARRVELPSNFCFFIDGLDEYGDDHADLCMTLSELAESSQIKLCVSSRPWNLFVDSFGGVPDRMLRLQDLTRNDITVFAKGSLEEHPRWRSSPVPHGEMASIITDICDRAEGVFLWVFLVTRSLRDGLSNGDTVKELRDRLDSIPRDLEQLFRHMLDKVTPIYHSQMAEMLQIVLQAKEPLGLEVYAFQRFEYDDQDYAINMPVNEMPKKEKVALADEARRRINSRTSGILECSDQRPNCTVNFLHRTVSDFLRTAEMEQYLKAKCRPEFDVYLSITRMHTAYIK
ncbi:hypothetical protein GQ53DRAFT_606013, partial [Thozetella sp. PMI_491]